MKNALSLTDALDRYETMRKQGGKYLIHETEPNSGCYQIVKKECFLWRLFFGSRYTSIATLAERIKTTFRSTTTLTSADMENAEKRDNVLKAIARIGSTYFSGRLAETINSIHQQYEIAPPRTEPLPPYVEVPLPSYEDATRDNPPAYSP
jgi:hypothetical protein